VTLFDSSEMYPVPQRAETQGRSEQFLGRWLRESRCRERVVVATKVAGPAGMPWLRGGPARLDAGNIRAALEASLLRLRTDRVELLQLHWPDRRVAAGAISVQPSERRPEKLRPDVRRRLVRRLRGLRRLGAAAGAVGGAGPAGCCRKGAFGDETGMESRLKTLAQVRAIGLSNETPWGLLKFLSLADAAGGALPRVACLQNAYSLTCRTFEVPPLRPSSHSGSDLRSAQSALAECCHREGVSMLAYSPLAMARGFVGHSTCDSLRHLHAGPPQWQVPRAWRRASTRATEPVQGPLRGGRVPLSPRQVRSVLTSAPLSLPTSTCLAANRL